LNFIITSEEAHIENFTNIRSATAEMFHVDGRTDGHDIASSRSS